MLTPAQPSAAAAAAAVGGGGSVATAAAKSTPPAEGWGALMGSDEDDWSDEEFGLGD